MTIVPPGDRIEKKAEAMWSERDLRTAIVPRDYSLHELFLLLLENNSSTLRISNSSSALNNALIPIPAERERSVAEFSENIP
jgi:hypothetical protein